MEASLSGKLSSLSLISQKKLESILAGCGVKSDLIIEPSLIEPLERVCAASWLRLRGIDKIYKLEAKINTSVNSSRVYMIPSCLIKLKYILDQINEFISKNNSTDDYNISIIIIPKVLAAHEALLEEEGLAGSVNLLSYQWEMILMDQSVLSLEFPSIFKSVFINKDASLISSLSNSLWTLFQVIGKPNIFISVGKQSHSIMEMYDVFSETFDKSNTTKADKDIGALIIVDRDQDYASGLLTPATYSGLLYELFNIKCGKLDLDVSNTKLKQGQVDLNLPIEAKDEKAQPKTNTMLDSDTDLVYAEIRYRHFSTVFSILNSKVKALNAEGGSVSNLRLDQMKQYVSTKLEQVITSKRILASHILACETIVASLGDKFEDLQIAERSMLYNRNKKSNISYLETNFCTDSNMYKSLQLLCLLSITQGISYEEYTSLVTKYLHAFGYKFLYIFQNLSNAGLLITPSSAKMQLGIPNLSTISDRLPLWQTNNFQTVANKLKQLPSENEEIKVSEPTCPSYIFNGSYIPFVAALAKILLTTENVNDLITKLSVINEVKLSVPFFEGCKKSVDDLGDKISQLKVDESNVPCDIDVACKDIKTAANYLKSDSVKFSIMPLRPKALLIFIVGGVTQAEVAACHLVEKLTGGRIVIASDSLISGDALMKATM